jgi:HK97 family phage prohead protease
MNLSTQDAAAIRKAFEGYILKADAVRGEVTMVANSTNVVDKQRDVVLPGAYRKVIREKQEVVLCWQHDHDPAHVIGKITEMDEWMPGDPRLPASHLEANAGAFVVKALFAMATTAGKDAWELIRGGFVKQWSVCFSTDPAKTERRGGDNFISEIEEMLEISAVLRGASPGTMTLAVKSAWDRVATMSYGQAERLAETSGREAGLALADEVEQEYLMSGEYLTQASVRQVEDEERIAAEDLAFAARKSGLTVWQVAPPKTIKRKVETEDERWIRVRAL